MNNTLPSRFTIRVYGLFLNGQNEVLVTDEFQLDMRMTKFPGGGLRFGEGTTDCLRREMIEECGQPIGRLEHFYTTDFYQKALFYPDHQLISIYYIGILEGKLQFRVSETPFDFEPMENGKQSFRWVKIDALDPEDFTFPIDRYVASLLKTQYHGQIG